MPQKNKCVYKVSDVPGHMFCHEPVPEQDGVYFQLCEKHAKLFEKKK